MDKNSSKKNIRSIVLTGGGTGGHIYPCVAVAQELKAQNLFEKIYYMGCKKNLEYQIAKKENLQFLSVNVTGFPRTLNLKLIKSLFQLVFSSLKCIFYFLKIKPRVVLATGGYVSAPAIIASIFLKIPFVMHDSDAKPGIVSRAFSKYASAVCVSFEDAKKYINNKNVILNGNPLRGGFKTMNKDEALLKLGFDSDKRTLFLMGGSQGAKTINDAVLGCIKELVIDNNIQVIHQVGNKNYDTYMVDLKEQWSEYQDYSQYKPLAYIEDMNIPYAVSDVVVARAGSLSISELNLNELPSILVPYPHAASDHQRHNAKAMEQSGASLYLEDVDCNSMNLKQKVLDLIVNQEKLNNMKQANKKLAMPDSTKNIVKLLTDIET